MPEQGRFCPTFNGHLAKVTFLHHYTTVPLTISLTRLLPYSPRPVGRIIRRSPLLGHRCPSVFEGHFTRSPHASTIDLVMQPPT